MLRKIIYLSIFALIIVGIFIVAFKRPVYANHCTISGPANINPGQAVTVTINNSHPAPILYSVSVSPGSYTSPSQPGTGGSIQFTVPGDKFPTPNTTYTVTVNANPTGGSCTNSLAVSTVAPGVSPPPAGCLFYFAPQEYSPDPTGNATVNFSVTINNSTLGHNYQVDISTNVPVPPQTKSGNGGTITFNFTVTTNGSDIRIFVRDITSGNDCSPTPPLIDNIIKALPLSEVTPPPGASPGTGQNPCGPTGAECPTALGNIPTDAGAFATKILTIAIGLAGGIAFILMVIGAIRVLTSAGNPQNVNAGRDMIVAALAGLLFLIFSVLILKFIGVEIIELSG